MKTRSKKTKTENNQEKSKEKNKFDQLPLDLEIEIFRRLPLKSVARFLTLSKSCAATIRSPSFITSFRSPQPCTLIASAPIFNCLHPFKPRVLVDHKLSFFSSSSSSSSSTSFLSRLTCPSSPYPRHMEYYCHYVNGLISVGYGREQIVTNPSTGRFITLPSVRTKRRLVKSFFGYDPASDQYKIATTIPDHRPWTNGVCIDGVVYYIAKTGQGMSQLSLMRYDLRDDNLNVFISLPEEIRTPSLYSDTLLNYEGKLAIAIPVTSYIFDVWVMDQDGEKHEWLKKITFNIEPWQSSFDDIRIKGTTLTGEFIFAPMNNYCDDEFYVFHYKSQQE
ncbi:unnamed protein product [Arabidopsis thaliana]|uniref:F-box domain-containing protein n=1 Tax=Arabidopsis thaliana TaxID=3702 RepID=A0A654EDU1_ARATH|nr:unnamed protein product [Arabidopsis thaliana]